MSIPNDEKRQTEKLEHSVIKPVAAEFENISGGIFPEILSAPVSSNSEINFKQIFESLSVMFYIENFDPVYELEYISPAFECLGYSLDEIYADPKILDRVMHPDDLLMMKEENKKIYDGTIRESSYAYRIFTKSGEMRWWKDQGRPIFNEKGERVKWFGVIYDITERKKTISELEEANQKLEKNSRELAAANDFTENVMNSMMDFVVVLDMEFKITRVNPAAVSLTGYEKEELVGQSVNKLAADYEFTKKRLNALRRFGGNSNLIKYTRCKDGTLLPITLSMVILKDENGEECGIVCVGKNISEIMNVREDLEKSNARLRQSNRELQDFAYVASHDLQEPLRKIQAFGDRLQRKCAGLLDDESYDYINRMRGAAGRMQNLINDLLTFSRVTTKAQPFKPVDVSQITKEVISDLEVRIEQTCGEVEIGELPVIDADPVQMRQLIQNLVGNALKFHRPGEKPIVKVYAEMPTAAGSFRFSGDDVKTNGNGTKICKIVVQDNGIGFEEKYLEKIFTVFQRLHGRSEYEGSGIGLAVCRKIAERHGGSITAQSEPNKGSTFFVTLPVSQNIEEINAND